MSIDVFTPPVDSVIVTKGGVAGGGHSAFMSRSLLYRFHFRSISQTQTRRGAVVYALAAPMCRLLYARVRIPANSAGDLGPKPVGTNWWQSVWDCLAASRDLLQHLATDKGSAQWM